MGNEVKIVRDIGEIAPCRREATLCFTGHRTQKLPWGEDEWSLRCIEMQRVLRREIEAAIAAGYDTFLCGMAMGFDIICAETVLDLRRMYGNIRLFGVLPCRDQASRWSARNRARYERALAQLDGVRCVYETYAGPACMQERNHYMVNASSAMIALYNGTPGGTRATVEYARRQGVRVTVIEP